MAQPANVPRNSLDGPLYEFACHDGNNSMPLILSAASAHERAEEAASREIMALSVGDSLGVYEVTAKLRG